MKKGNQKYRYKLYQPCFESKNKLLKKLSKTWKRTEVLRLRV